MSKKKSKPEICKKCNGRGTWFEKASTRFGIWSLVYGMTRKCNLCRGTGIRLVIR